MPTPSLNYVALHVADLERSQAFFEEVLKLQRIDRPNFLFRVSGIGWVSTKSCI